MILTIDFLVNHIAHILFDNKGCFMKLLKYIFFVILIVQLFSCVVKIPREITKATNLIIGSQTEHYNDRSWKREEFTNIYHDDMNPLGDTLKYENTEFVNRPNGLYIFSSVKLLDITTGFENLVLADDHGNWLPEQRVEIYIAKLEYQIVAKNIYGVGYSENSMPEILNAYILFARDVKDGLYKIIDFVPGQKTNFVSEVYVQEHLNEFDFNRSTFRED